MATESCSECFMPTKYECIRCGVPICNLCSDPESDDTTNGWLQMKRVGYCLNCSFFKERNLPDRPNSHESSEPRRNSSISGSSPTSDISNNSNSSQPNSAKKTTERTFHNGKRGLDHESSDSSELSLVMDTLSNGDGSRRKKKTGRKAQWSDEVLDDFIDIIISDEKYQQKLIITNTKNQQNGVLYDKILKELKRRCSLRDETINFNVQQLRNKFKKCVAECKHAAMTLKAATGIKRFQEDKGYGAWFEKLFPLIQTRDSCQPHLAIEPGCSNSNDTQLLDLNKASYETEENDERGSKQFVPVRKMKSNPKEQLTDAVNLLKTILEHDPTKDLLKFMQEEAEKARKHELELTKLILNSPNQAPSPQLSTYYQPYQLPNPSHNYNICHPQQNLYGSDMTHERFHSSFPTVNHDNRCHDPESSPKHCETL